MTVKKLAHSSVVTRSIRLAILFQSPSRVRDDIRPEDDRANYVAA